MGQWHRPCRPLLGQGPASDFGLLHPQAAAAACPDKPGKPRARRAKKYRLRQQLRGLRSTGGLSHKCRGCRELKLCRPDSCRPSSNRTTVVGVAPRRVSGLLAGRLHGMRQACRSPRVKSQDCAAAIRALGSAGWWQEALALFRGVRAPGTARPLGVALFLTLSPGAGHKQAAPMVVDSRLRLALQLSGSDDYKRVTEHARRYNAAIAALRSSPSCWQQACALAQSMRGEHLEPDISTVNSAATALKGHDFPKIRSVSQVQLDHVPCVASHGLDA